MKIWHSITILVFAAIVAYFLTLALHGLAHAKAYEGPVQQYIQQERMPPRPENIKVEWHIRAFITKDHHPVTYADYGGETFDTAAACLGRLAKPDAKLAGIRKQFLDMAKVQFAGATVEWSCAAALVPIPGQGV